MTVTVTIPVPSGVITKTVVPTAATTVVNGGKPGSGAAASTASTHIQGKPSQAASGSDGNSGKPGSGAAASTPVQAASGMPSGAASGSGLGSASTPVQAASGKASGAASGTGSGSAWATGNPIGGYSGNSNSNLNGIKTFTGGAAGDQAPATAFSVAVCVVLAVAGLIL